MAALLVLVVSVTALEYFQNKACKKVCQHVPVNGSANDATMQQHQIREMDDVYKSNLQQLQEPCSPVHGK